MVSSRPLSFSQRRQELKGSVLTILFPRGAPYLSRDTPQKRLFPAPQTVSPDPRDIWPGRVGLWVSEGVGTTSLSSRA